MCGRAQTLCVGRLRGWAPMCVWTDSRAGHRCVCGQTHGLGTDVCVGRLTGWAPMCVWTDSRAGHRCVCGQTHGHRYTCGQRADPSTNLGKLSAQLVRDQDQPHRCLTDSHVVLPAPVSEDGTAASDSDMPAATWKGTSWKTVPAGKTDSRQTRCRTKASKIALRSSAPAPPLTASFSQSSATEFDPSAGATAQPALSRSERQPVHVPFTSSTSICPRYRLPMPFSPSGGRLDFEKVRRSSLYPSSGFRGTNRFSSTRSTMYNLDADSSLLLISAVVTRPGTNLSRSMIVGTVSCCF
jgi:hypothetical protein